MFAYTVCSDAVCKPCRNARTVLECLVSQTIDIMLAILETIALTPLAQLECPQFLIGIVFKQPTLVLTYALLEDCSVSYPLTAQHVLPVLVSNQAAMSTTSQKPCSIMHACRWTSEAAVSPPCLKLLGSLLATAATRDGSAAVTPLAQEANPLAAARFCFHKPPRVEGPAESRQHQVRSAMSEL